MKPIHINSAEAVIEAFWDSELSTFHEWDNEVDGALYGLFIKQDWCFVRFGWNSKPKDGICFILSKSFDIDISDYDNLVLSVMLPEHSVIIITAKTNKGELTFTSPHAKGKKKEYSLKLGGADYLSSVTIELKTVQEGQADGWFNFILLQNEERLAHHLKLLSGYDNEWEGYLKPDDYEPKFEPFNKLVLTEDELVLLRQNPEHFIPDQANAPKDRPEDYIKDFVNFWDDTRYCRERDHGKELLRKAPKMAMAAIVLKDKALLRLAARYALSIAFCDNWDDGMICKMKGSNWDHRCFVQANCCQEVSFILAIAGELFTPMGIDYIYRRLAEEGISSITFNTWKYEYIFYMNQLTWFSYGRSLALATLLNVWPRVDKYLEIAKDETFESLDYCILPEGSCVEGPAYFEAIVQGVLYTQYYSSRAYERDFSGDCPRRLLESSKFAEAIMSTDINSDYVRICDCTTTKFKQDILAFLAYLMPNSAWTAMFKKAMNRDGISDYLASIFDNKIQHSTYELSNYLVLEDMGIVTSLRKFNGKYVKFFFFGNKAGASHTHEDKGSFILEYGGETFAAEQGSCDYSDPLSYTMKNCDRHNMLVPFGTSERPKPDSTIESDIYAKSNGNDKEFYATMNVTLGFEEYYKIWERSISSPNPCEFVITDKYELVRGDGVDFFWSTDADISIDENVVKLRKGESEIEISAPSNCIIRIDTLPLSKGREQRRIGIRKFGKKSEFSIYVKLCK